MDVQKRRLYARSVSLLSFFLLPGWFLLALHTESHEENSPSPSYRQNFRLRRLQQDEALDGRRFLGLPSASDSAAAGQPWAPQGPHEGPLHLRETATHLPVRADIEGARAQLGIQEPLSFYGHVNVPDPAPTPKIPVWMW